MNDAVYVAQTGPEEKAEWTAVGAQFKVPYVYKTLFSGEPILAKDLAETKQVAKGHMVLEFESGDHFVGRTGRFVPVRNFGGKLSRVHEGKKYAVTGTKGYHWIEQEMFQQYLDNDNGDGKNEAPEIDYDYFENLVGAAKNTISKFGNFEEFVS